MAHFKINNEEIEIKNLKVEENILKATINGEKVAVEVEEENPVFVKINGIVEPIYAVKDEKGNIYFQYQGISRKLEHIAKGVAGAESGEASGKIEPPMPGKILELKVKQGETVEKNQTILLMESMKLQVEIKAPFNGVLKALNCQVNQMVNPGEIIAEVEEKEDI